MSETDEELQRKHQQSIDIINRTHQIFCGIKGKEIALLYNNPPGHTDTESFVSIPIEDKDAELILSHEWQHIFFKSNLRARATFSESYSKSLQLRIPSINQDEIKDFINLLVNGLDDLRVCSLWELIYPHSAEQIQERWRNIVLGSERYQSDIVMYLIGLGVGLDSKMDRSEWKRYRIILLDAVQKVIRSGFTTCLLASRWIMESILSDVTTRHLAPNSHTVLPPKPSQFIPSSAQPPVGSRLGTSVSRVSGGQTVPMTNEETQKKADTLQKLQAGTTSIPHRGRSLNPSWKMMDTFQQPTGKDPNWQETKSMVDVAMGVSTPQQVEIVLKQNQLDVDRIIDDLKHRSRVLTHSQRLVKGLEGSVEVRNIERTEVEELRLSESDKKLSSVLRHHFTRLMDSRKQVTADTGTILDPQAYVDFLNGSPDSNFFIEEENSRGFSALILLDMSGSMKSKWHPVARACKVIAQAMSFPFSKVEVWGFTSLQDGIAVIYKFEDPKRGYVGSGTLEAWGLTPLHIAVEVASRQLQSLPGSAQHLLILTDGYPTHINKQLIVSPEELVLEVARHIQCGRKKGINVSGLVSGYEVSDGVATAMFGHRRFWKRVSGTQEDLFQSLLDLAKGAFVGYLKSK